MSEQTWLPVEEFSGLLEVSKCGEVRTLDSYRAGSGKNPSPQFRKGRVLRPFVGSHGYAVVAPKFGPSRKKLLVHRLVALAFVPGYFNGATVNHIDGCKLNNSSENLEWITKAENTAHQWRIGLVNIRGDRHPSVKLSNAEVKDVRNRLASGETQTSIALSYNVSSSLIWNIMHGKKRTSYTGPL